MTCDSCATAGAGRASPPDWPALLARHGRWLRAVVLARAGEPQAVEEVMQNVAVAAVKSADPPAEPGRVGPWLYRVAVRQSLLYRRGLGRQRRLRARYAGRRSRERRDGAADDPLAWLLADEQRQLIRSALGRLHGRDAEVLLLKYGESWSYAEIAEQTGTTPDAVRSRLARARDRLRAELTALGVVEAGVRR